jgi:hypothetical protein
LLLPTAKEGADLASLHRSMDNDRWPSLPPPPPSYTLPAIQSHPHGPPPTSNSPPTLPPPQSISPGSYPPSGSPSLPPYLPPPSSSNKLQPLQSWSTSRAPPPPPYSQSLPSLNAAAQHGFSMPPLPSSAPLQAHHPSRITPPPRSDCTPRPPTADLGTPGSDLTWMSSLGGDDVIAFIGGDSCDQWLPDAPFFSKVGVPSGWLGTIWGRQVE